MTASATSTPATRKRRLLPFSPWHLLLMPLSLLFVLPLLQMIVTSFMPASDINRIRCPLGTVADAHAGSHRAPDRPSSREVGGLDL